MSSKKRSRALTVLTCGIALSTLGAGSVAWAADTHGSTPARAVAPASAQTLPQTTAAHLGAAWLASQVNAKGYVESSGKVDLSDTTLTILALASVHRELNAARTALGYVEHHVNAYVKEAGADGAGELATLILDARALGANPRSFGGTNLVQRLLATERTSGTDAGLFGVQPPTYDGSYRQGLALAALAAAGVTGTSEVALAVSWLQNQQCANGGWEAFRTSTAKACTRSSTTTYSGPDTNSTALAVEGLTSQHATIKRSPVSFFTSLQASSGGWGYYGGAADPDSTSLVIQALVALHVTVSSSRFQKGTLDPVSALLSFQLPSGAFYYPTEGSPNVASALATEQAIPPLVKKAFPF